MLGTKGEYDINLEDYAWVAPIDKKLVSNLERAIAEGRLRQKGVDEKTAGGPGGLNI